MQRWTPTLYSLAIFLMSSFAVAGSDNGGGGGGGGAEPAALWLLGVGALSMLAARR